MKFPQGEGSAVIHRKKNRPASQRPDILTFFFFSFFYFCIGNLLSSSCTKFLVVLFFIAFYTAPFSSKHFFLGLFVRSLSTQQFFVMVLLLLLSMTAFSYVGLLFLFSWVRLFHALCLSHLPCSSFLEGLSSDQFAELGSVHLLAFSARACSLAFLFSVSPMLTICRAFLFFFFLGGGGRGVLLYLVLWGGGDVLRPFSLYWFCWFQLFWGLIFFFFFPSDFFPASSTVLFFFLVLFFLAGLHCLLRMHTITPCVGDTWQRLWRGMISPIMVNRLKIPQGLSTLMFRRWSAVPSRGGVRGDSP